MELRDVLERDLAAYEYEGPTPEALDEEPPPAPDADRANALLRRCRRLAEDAAEIDALYESERKRLDAWREDRLAGIARERSWLERSLEGFFRRYAAERRVKSLRLPHGFLRLRAPRERVVIDDPDAFRAWVETTDAYDLVRVTVEPDRKALADLDRGGWTTATGTGEVATQLIRRGDAADDYAVVPGVAVVKGAEPTFTMEVGA